MINLKNRFRIEKILLTVTAIIGLCIFVSYVVYTGERIFIHFSLPDDYGIVNAKVSDWEELDSQNDFSFEGESGFSKYSYRFTYEYTVDNTTYTLNHDTNYIDKSVSNNTKMTVYYEKDNPVNSYLFTMNGYTYLFSKNITFQITYNEHIFETYYDIGYFLLFLLSIILITFVLIRIHRIKNGTRKIKFIT